MSKIQKSGNRLGNQRSVIKSHFRYCLESGIGLPRSTQHARWNAFPQVDAVSRLQALEYWLYYRLSRCRPAHFSIPADEDFATRLPESPMRLAAYSER